jgi:hypothetical protein
MDATTHLSRYFTPKAPRTTTFVLNQSDPLEMMQGQLSTMADEMERLKENMHTMMQLKQALLDFNASFSMFIKGLELNSTCVEWSENPGSVSFERALARMQAPIEVEEPPPPPKAAAPRTTKVHKKGILKKPVFPVDRVLAKLPVRYQNPPHYGMMDLIVRTLHDTPEGMYLYDLIKLTGCPRVKCTEYMTALVNAKIMLKSNKKGILYQFDTAHHY